MIPKIIHYCWFGKGPKDKLFKKCYKSWQKYFPDYKIIEWNEDNFDFRNNSYAKEAYNAKKYAFVSDYARLKILYDNGGIYFDTDVEVLKKFEKAFLENGYLAKEKDNIINTGLGFAVPPQSKIIKIMLDDYQNIHFIDKDGNMDLKPCTIRNTNSLLKRGYIIDKKNLPIDNIKVYSREYFCGFDLDNNHTIISNKTYTLHHYSGTWLSKKYRVKQKLKRLISKIIGINNYNYLRKKLKKK